MKSIIFDLDGTLIDTNELIISSFDYVFNKYLKKLSLNRNDFIQFIGPTLEETFNKYNMYGYDTKFLVNEYRKYNHMMHDEMVRIYPNVYSTLEYLHKRYKLAIVSSKKRDLVLRGLKLFNIDQFFNLIIAADDIKVHKPNPDGILLAMKKLESSEAIYIGDNQMDVYAAKNAKCVSVGVLWSYKKDLVISSNPDYLISDMKELIKIVGE